MRISNVDEHDRIFNIQYPKKNICNSNKKKLDFHIASNLDCSFLDFLDGIALLIVGPVR